MRSGGEKILEAVERLFLLRKRDLDPQVRMAHYREEKYA
jgi:hypothetical protein